MLNNYFSLSLIFSPLPPDYSSQDLIHLNFGQFDILIIDGGLPILTRSFLLLVLLFDGAVLNYDGAIPNKHILTELLPPPLLMV